MKVKCVEDTIINLSYGVSYEVISESNYFYVIKDDIGEVIQFCKENFTVIDEPKIEVGSEWLWEEANETLVVKCVGDTSVFYQWIYDGSEGCEEIDDFLKYFKQKPKTVTMYFHKTKTGEYYAQETKCTGYLFTREIEL